jgi:hypothetical protein
VFSGSRNSLGDEAGDGADDGRDEARRFGFWGLRDMR